MENAGSQAISHAKQNQAKGVKVRLWGTPTLCPSRAPAGHRGLGGARFPAAAFLPHLVLFSETPQFLIRGALG